MDLGLRDAAVVVNGGTKGMGRAAAERFAGDGARVCVLARGQQGLDATVAAMEGWGAADAACCAALKQRARGDLASLPATPGVDGRRWRTRCA